MLIPTTAGAFVARSRRKVGIVKAHVAPSRKSPQTLHYMGDGAFMLSGKTMSRRSKFLPGML